MIALGLVPLRTDTPEWAADFIRQCTEWSLTIQGGFPLDVGKLASHFRSGRKIPLKLAGSSTQGTPDLGLSRPRGRVGRGRVLNRRTGLLFSSVGRPSRDAAAFAARDLLAHPRSRGLGPRAPHAQGQPQLTLRLDVTRDTWVSEVGQGSRWQQRRRTRLKLKSIQEMTPDRRRRQATRGRTIRSATLHLKKAGDERLEPGNGQQHRGRVVRGDRQRLFAIKPAARRSATADTLTFPGRSAAAISAM